MVVQLLQTVHQRFCFRSKISASLDKERAKLKWTKEAQNAFKTLQNRLISAPILSLPDISKSFILDTDTSKLSIGEVISQEIDGK